MISWQEDLLYIAFDDVEDEYDIFGRIEKSAAALGFEYVAYGFQSPLPFTKPKITQLNNYPRLWQEHYSQAGYLQIDPTVAHARQSRAPLIWSDQIFTNTQNLWNEAKTYGLKVGWAQSNLDDLGAGSMVTFARSCQSLTTQELDIKQLKMKWLAQVAHFTLSRFFRSHGTIEKQILSNREIEVLKWSADGKSAQDIADILNLSKNTIDFHIKNSVTKLQVPNKTAAVVRAALSGLLN
jgi:LuxR family transcriptional regulator